MPQMAGLPIYPPGGPQRPPRLAGREGGSEGGLVGWRDSSAAVVVQRHSSHFDPDPRASIDAPWSGMETDGALRSGGVGALQEGDQLLA
jgi:hypothetical protein